VEHDAYAAGVLCARQNDGLLEPFPIWSDVRTFDGRPWRGAVDVVSGGFPCQDISLAGKGAGIDGERSGLWSHMARIVGEVRPGFVYVENSPALLIRGIGRVINDLAALGYGCQWGVLGAADVGAPHQRDRLWLVATDTGCAHGQRWPNEQGAANGHAPERHEATDHARERCALESMADANSVGQLQPQRLERQERRRPCNGCDAGDTDSARLAQRQGIAGHDGTQQPSIERADWWQLEPDVGRVANELADGLDIL
jgi:DNA (cytosine-5)-methyltransferase 1